MQEMDNHAKNMDPHIQGAPEEDFILSKSHKNDGPCQQTPYEQALAFTIFPKLVAELQVRL
jgi:hypothetical protein